MVRRSLSSVAGVTLGIALLGVATRPASAEPYFAAYVGAAFTERTDLRTELEVNGAPLAIVRAHSLSVDTSPVFGGKFGYFFDVDLLGGNTGIELDVFHFEPDVPKQNVKFSGTLLGVSGDTRTDIQSADVQITAITLNALYRFRLAADADYPRGRFQPYIGIGAGAYIARLSTTTSPFDVNKDISDTDVRAGFQALAGARVFLTRHIALFAEYKFVQTQTFSFTFKEGGTRGGFPVTETARDRAGFNGPLLYGGLGIHW